VSEILNTSEGSVKMAFFRATRKLRFHLGKYAKKDRPLTKRPDDGVNQLQKTKTLTVISESEMPDKGLNDVPVRIS
jgi:hypothetical protein